jgi:hypothetical protein
MYLGEQCFHQPFSFLKILILIYNIALSFFLAAWETLVRALQGYFVW